MNTKNENIEDYLDNHYVHKSNWIRAAVLGSNDGILSTASIAIGVASAMATREQILLTAVAGLVAGALSMAAGEYVSVSSQTDIEKADIERERIELEEMPKVELMRLAKIYEERGLCKETALQVAKELTEHDALKAHVRDELGITETSQANPLQAAFASGLSFTSGGILPVFVAFFAPLENMEIWLYFSAILFLMLLGAIAARAGGSSIKNAVVRITFWGTLAMGATAIVGNLFGVNLA